MSQPYRFFFSILSFSFLFPLFVANIDFFSVSIICHSWWIFLYFPDSSLHCLLFNLRTFSFSYSHLMSFSSFRLHLQTSVIFPPIFLRTGKNAPGGNWLQLQLYHRLLVADSACLQTSEINFPSSKFPLTTFKTRDCKFSFQSENDVSRVRRQVVCRFATSFIFPKIIILR